MRRSLSSVVAALFLAAPFPLSAEPLRLAIGGEESVRVELFRADGGSCSSGHPVPLGAVTLGAKTPEAVVDVPPGTGPVVALVTGPPGGPCGSVAERAGRGPRSIRYLHPPREASIRGTLTTPEGGSASGVSVTLRRVSALPCVRLRRCQDAEPVSPPSVAPPPQKPSVRRDPRERAPVPAAEPAPPAELPQSSDFTDLTFVTKSDGRFRFERLPAGEYQLSIGGGKDVPPRRGRVTVDDGQAFDLGTVSTGLVPGSGRIDGRVDGPSDGLGEQVFLLPLDRQREIPPPVFVSSDGRFTFSSVAPGRWQVEWRKDARTARAGIVRVVSDEPAETVLSREPVEFHGTVTHGVLGVAADLCLFDDDGLAAPCGVAKPDGSFSFRLAGEPRDFRLVVRTRAGREAGIVIARIPAADVESPQSIDVPSGGQVVRYVFEDGRPAAGATVEVRRGEETFATLDTDESGLLELPSTLPSAGAWKYRIAAPSASGESHLHEDDLPRLFGRGPAIFVELPLRAWPERAFRLLDSAGAPLALGALLVREGKRVRSFRADSDGRIHVEAPITPDAELFLTPAGAVAPQRARKVPFSGSEERLQLPAGARHELRIRFTEGGRPFAGGRVELHRDGLPDDVVAEALRIAVGPSGSTEAGTLRIAELLEGDWGVRPVSPGRDWGARTVELAGDRAIATETANR